MNANRQNLYICLFLVFATIAVYWQTLDFDFVNFDDQIYVTDNYHVKQGLTADSIKWAFVDTTGNWNPITWLSHMLDYQLYGLNPKGHHLTNLLFHLANVVLLFLVLGR